MHDNPIGNGKSHVAYFIEDFSEYPQISASVSFSETSESVYVNYLNSANIESITVRFSNHVNNATRFGDQLDGYSCTRQEILYRLGLKKRIFIPGRKKTIYASQVAKSQVSFYETTDITIQEMYNLPVGTSLEKYTGKLAKDSRWLILGDAVEEVEITTRNAFGQYVRAGHYEYLD